MNFTKPGKKDLKQRIFMRTEGKEWTTIGEDSLRYVKTRVARRKNMLCKEDSDQDDEQDDKKRKRTVYFYSLLFDVDFKTPNESVYFAFSEPYTYSQIAQDL